MDAGTLIMTFSRAMPSRDASLRRSWRAVVRDVRRHFHAGRSRPREPYCRKPAEQVSCIADIANCERFVQGHRRHITVPLDAVNRVEVIGAAGDGFSKIEGFDVRREGLFSNPPFEFTAREQASAQVVQPDRLAERLQAENRIRRLGMRCRVRLACVVSASVGESIMCEPLRLP